MREKINISNYEVWLLDYIEGNLDNSKEADLMLFLEANPELGQDIVDPEMFKLTPPETKYKNKKSIKRNDNFDYLMIGSIEQTLTNEEEKELTKLINSDSSLKSELNIYRKTKLEPNTSVTYKNKALLHKNIVFNWRPIASIAAAVILIATSMFVLQSIFSTPTNNMAKSLAKNNDLFSTTRTIKNNNQKHNIQIANSNTNTYVSQENFDINNKTETSVNKEFIAITTNNMEVLKPSTITSFNNNELLAFSYREIPEFYETQHIKVTYITGYKKKTIGDYWADAKEIKIPNPIQVLKEQKQELLSYNILQNN